MLKSTLKTAAAAAVIAVTVTACGNTATTYTASARILAQHQSTVYAIVESDVYAFYSDDKYSYGDAVILTMSDNGTPDNITDDIIVNVNRAPAKSEKEYKQ